MAILNILTGLFNSRPKSVNASPTGELMVQMGGQNISAFGDLIVSPGTPLIQFDFTTGLNTQIVASTVLNNATVDTSSFRSRLQSGTNNAGSALLVSTKSARYRAGQGITARFTYVWTNSAASSTHYVGMGNANDGYFFGYSGTTFGIIHRLNTVDTLIPQTSWNGDKCDGTGASSFNWNKTFGNAMQIRYSFLGYGVMYFSVLHPTGYWISCHTIQYPNSTANIQLSNPNLSFYARALNAGNTTNLIGYCGSVGVLLSGQRKFLGPRWGLNNSKSVTSGSATNIITIKNATTYNGVANTGLLRLTSITVAFGNLVEDKIGVVRLVKNATVAGSPSFTAVNGTLTVSGATITNGNSPTSYDVAGTTVTTGITVWNVTGAMSTTIRADVSEHDLFLAPGERYTFVGENNSTSFISVAFNWVEDI